MGHSQEPLVILTKKSKLKRKRKYLVTLIQVDPILLVLELPWEKREQAGQCWWDKTGLGRGEPMRTGNHHLLASDTPNLPLQQPQELGRY